MVIGSRQRLGTFDRSPALKIDNVLIKQVGSTKSLGVHVDEHLTWNTHVSHISKEIASGIGAIKRCRPFAPTEALVCAYNAIVQPHFNYCDIVWGGRPSATFIDTLKKDLGTDDKLELEVCMTNQEDWRARRAARLRPSGLIELR